MRDTFKSVTLDELIDALEDARNAHGGDMIVTFASNYGDRSRTQQVHELSGDVDELPICERPGYSVSGFAIDESEDDDSDEECTNVERQRVLVIS